MYIFFLSNIHLVDNYRMCIYGDLGYIGGLKEKRSYTIPNNVWEL